MSFISAAVGSAVGAMRIPSLLERDPDRDRYLLGQAQGRPSQRQLEDMANVFKAIVDAEAGIYDVLRGTPTPSAWKCSYCGGMNEAKHHWCPGCGAAVGT